ncbi:MAG: hypothetical protein JWM95_4901 [Gemmatimonadetes bacterium]|nr:hypothetical protein [Gemmatimonadota bacterium]
MTIRSLVEREARHLRRAEVTAGVLLATAVVAGLLTIAGAALARARWLSLPRGVPIVAWCVVAAAVAALVWRTRQRLLTGDARDVALTIESEQGLRRGVLVGVLELEGQGPLAERAATKVRGSLPVNTPLAPEMRRASSRRAMHGAAAAAGGVLLLLGATPLFADGLVAMLRPIDAWRGKLLDTPRIEGAPAELLRGSPLRVSVKAPGRRVIYLESRQTGDAWRTDTLTVDPASGAAKWSVDALRGDLRLLASDGRTTSDSVIVRAADRPFVGAVTIHAHFLSYLGRADESLPIGEVLRLPRGTSLSIAGRASIPLADVALLGPAGERVNLGANGQAFNGQFTPDRSIRLHWSARGPGGLVPDLPEPLEIDVVADSAPHVIIAEPAGDTLLVSSGSVDLGLRVSDDHGVASVGLRIMRVGVRDAAPIAQPVATAVGTNWAGGATVDIGALHLAPGDAVSVRADAVDGSPWAQRGVSRELVLRRATTEEQRAAARAMGDSAVKEALAAASAQKSLAQRTDEAARSQARQGAAKDAQGGQGEKQKAMNFENAEKAKSLAQEQRAMADRVQKLRAATQQLEQQLKAAGALDTALARQLGEAQNLLKQAMTPELMAQMQKLEQASQQMNGEQSRDAMRDMASMQQKMKEQLERSAEMLKRAAQEGAMQTLGDEAKELAQKERKLAENQKQSDPSKKAGDAKEASQLADRTERLKDAMEELKSRLAKDKAEAGANKTGEAGKHAEKAESDLRKAAQEMRAEEKAQQQQQEGEAKPGGEKQGEAKPGQDGKPGGEPKQGSEGKPNGEPKPGQDGKPGGDSKSGQPKPGEGDQKSGQQGGQPQAGQQQGAKAAENAASEMDRAAKSMQDARSDQVKEWKQEITSELDQSAQELQQLAREERALEQKARSGQSADDRRSAQSAVEQGVSKANERLQGQGKKSALVSPRSQRSMEEAKAKVSQATESTQGGSDQKQASALSEAADALTKAAASLSRDRERANNANSASGFSEMMKEMQEMAQKQGSINGQSQSLLNMPNSQSSAAGQQLARSLARQQRQLAEQLDDAGDAAGGDRAEKLAQEARQLAEALDNGRLDGSTLARQQQLFRRLLDAGKTLEKEERDDTGKREAKSAMANDAFSPTGKVDTRAAVKFQPPTWQELRAMSADERRAVLDYFTRLNSAPKP